MTKNKINSDRLVKILGSILVLIALFFVFEKIWVNRSWFLGWRPTKQIAIVIVFGSMIYALSCFLLSTAWQRLLVWFGQADANVKKCYGIYARTQIAKYIPGNIFHIAGRHVLGHRVGLNHGPLAGAAVYEIMGLLLTSSAIALLGTILYGKGQIKVSILSSAAIFLSMLIILFIVAKRNKIPQLRKWDLPERNIVETAVGLIPVYILYLAFFLIIGGVLSWVASTISDINNIHQIGIVITAFSVSWIAGFITPGSPAGIGVREAMIVLLLSSMIQESESLLVALNFRVITLLGDVIFFLSAYLFRV